MSLADEGIEYHWLQALGGHRNRIEDDSPSRNRGIEVESFRNYADYMATDEFKQGVANVHVVKVTKGMPHVHTGYDEVYYVLLGTGTITLGQETHPLRPGRVAVIPAGVPRSLEAEPGQ